VVDLAQVPYFGSAFIRFLLKCHLIVKPHHSELVLAGCNDRVTELLHVMNFDTLWAIYRDRAEALQALGGSD
jgi:anti-anti-sigma regulatory factor